MAQVLQQSTPVDVLIGPFVDKTDGATAETGESPSVKLSKNGQTMAAKNDITTPVHDADGYYNCELDATDTNTCGNLVLTVAASANALPVRHEFQVVDENTWTAFYQNAALGPLTPTIAGRTLDITAGGAAGIDWGNVENFNNTVDLSATSISLCDTTTAVTNQVTANVTSWNSSAVAVPATAGVPHVNVVEIDDVAAAATNLEIIMDSAEGFNTAYSGPRGPGIYIDDISGSAGTADGVNGTVNNPLTTIADAITMNNSLGYNRIYLVNDTAITLAATMTDYEFIGIGSPVGNTIALGSQDVSNSSFYNVTITGVQGGSTRAMYEDCMFGTATIHAHAKRCAFTDGATGVTFSNNDDQILDGCYSAVAGNTAPKFIASSVNLDLSIRHWSGGIDWLSGAATATATVEGDGNMIFNGGGSANNSSFAVTIRGNISISDNTDNVTITETARTVPSTVADAVWDEAASGHTTAGTFGEQCGTDIDAILVDTNSLNDTKIPDTLSLANINAEVDTSMVTYGLDHLLSTSVTGTDVANNSIFAYLTSSSVTADWDTFVNTDDSLQAISESGGGGPTAAQIADAVWDEATSGHTTSGTFGQALYTFDEGTAAAGAATTITLEAGANSNNDFYNNSLIVLTGGTGVGQARFITDYVGSTRVATVDTWVTNPSTDTEYFIMPFYSLPGASAPTAAQVADAVWDEATAGHTTGGTFGEQLATDVDAILVDTNSLNDTKVPQTLNLTASGNIGIDWANVENPSSVVDLSQTDIQLVDTVTTNTDLVSAASIADAVWDEAMGDHITADTFGLANNVLRANVATAGAAGTITLDASASTTADLFNGAYITLVNGTGAGQTRLITDYSTGRVASVEPNWITNPASGTEFVIHAGGNVNLRTATQTSIDAIETDTNSLNDTKIPNTLNTTASGNIGIDWANVENPTSINDLSATDIQLVDTATTVTNQVTADVTAISGDATAADNAELMFDGTGYAGGTTKLGVDLVSISGDTTSADNLEASTETIVLGTAITGTLSTTQFTTNLSEATDDHYIGRTVIFRTGALAGQASDITDYTGSTKLITVTAMTEAPSNNDTFVII